MRVLVCGGRTYSNQSKVFEYLDRLRSGEGIDLIITGDARGADALGNLWATTHGVPLAKVPANWGYHGKSAGFIRNASMIELLMPELVVAFPGGRGTENMVFQASYAGIETRRIVE
jgi:YspA, cpYpsA-related SLOG family